MREAAGFKNRCYVCCMCTCVQIHKESRREHQMPRNWIYSAPHPTWVLGTEPRSFRAVSALNCRVTYPASQPLVFLCRWSYLVILTVCAQDTITSSLSDQGSKEWEAVCPRSQTIGKKLQRRQKLTAGWERPGVLSDPQGLLRSLYALVRNYNLQRSEIPDSKINLFWMLHDYLLYHRPQKYVDNGLTSLVDLFPKHIFAVQKNLSPSHILTKFRGQYMRYFFLSKKENSSLFCVWYIAPASNVS